MSLPSFEAADRARQVHETDLLARRHVNAVGTGLRWKDGQLTDERCVTVVVSKKRPRGYLPRTDVLPDRVMVDGVSCKVDVVQGGPFFGHGEAEFQAPPAILGGLRPRPLVHGCEVGNARSGGVGTLGCFVRDTTDGSVCILSNNHVLVVDNVADGPESIIQPGEGDAVAGLKRHIAYPPFPQTTPVDAAIAELNDPDLASHEFFGDRMAPISDRHPAIGLYFAGDPLNAVGLISRMEHILDALEIEMVEPAVAHTATGDDLGAHIEKVGRTTGYTSSKIWATNVTSPVQMQGQVYMFSNLIATTRFGWPGDSGSVVCLGGDGDTLIPLDVGSLTCEVMSSVGEMYDLPLAADEPLADRVRDEFLSESATGSLLIQVFYTNQDVILGRTSGVEASPTEKSYAAALYAKYHDFLISALDNKDDPDLVVTENAFADAQMALLGMRPYLTEAEDVAITSLYLEVMGPAVGMNFAELVDYMNEPATAQRVLNILEPVPTIEIPGPFTGV